MPTQIDNNREKMETRGNIEAREASLKDNPSASLPSPVPRFSWKSRRRSFIYAFKGIRYAFKTQHNMWLHAIAAAIAILLGFILAITAIQWLVILLCIGAVFALEIINTAIEALVDHLHPERHPKIGLVKDLAAGAVLIAAILSLIIGCIIFLPLIWAHAG